MIQEYLISNTHSLIVTCTELFDNINKNLKIDDNEFLSLNITQKKRFLLFCCIDDEYFDNKYNNRIIELKHFLNELNIQYDKNSYSSIELNYGYSNDKEIATPFIIHNDIGSKINGESYTIIVYLNTNCKYGELIFYDETYCSFESNRIINPNSNSSFYTKVVIFDGSLYHCPDNFFGKRCAFVFQIKK